MKLSERMARGESWTLEDVIQLEAENTALELERDTLKAAISIAMNENQRLNKYVEDYAEEQDDET